MLEGVVLLVMLFVFVIAPCGLLMAWGLGKMGRSAGQLIEQGRQEERRRQDGG